MHNSPQCGGAGGGRGAGDIAPTLCLTKTFENSIKSRNTWPVVRVGRGQGSMGVSVVLPMLIIMCYVTIKRHTVWLPVCASNLM